jgi:predicted protein tyrosine phosphatase
MPKKRLLFVCTGNIDRSPTAEAMFSGIEGFEVKSAGTSIMAKNVVTEDLIQWADIIFCMEEKHKRALIEINPLSAGKIQVLEIPDIYFFGQPELKQLIFSRMENYLNNGVWMKKFWDRIYKFNDSNFYSKVCKNCCTDLLRTHAMSLPQPIPYVGSFFFFSKYRILFVGRESFENKPRDKENPGLNVDYDPFLSVNDNDSLDQEFWDHITQNNSGSNFWRWVINISTKLEGEKSGKQLLNPQDALAHIAYSNLFKCQVRYRSPNDKQDDKTILKDWRYHKNEKVIHNCIEIAQWIYHEIEELDARNVILFAGSESSGLARAFLSFGPEKVLNKFKNSIFYLENLYDGKRRIIITNHPSALGTYRPPDDIADEIVKIVSNDVKGEIWSMPKPYTESDKS